MCGASIVRRVYALYLEHRSLLAVIEALRDQGVPHRLRQCDTGLNVGKLVWSTGHIRYMLTNATYSGKIVHTRGANLPEGKGRCPTDIWPGLHEPIIDPEIWDRVQALINRRERAPATRWSHNGCQGDDRHPAHRPLLDELTLSVFWNGNVLALGHTHAFWLLARLTRSANQYVTRVDLIQEVWDDVFT